MIKMTNDASSQGRASDLLLQFENILETDTLINEVGFVHPSQFAALNEGLIILSTHSLSDFQSSYITSISDGTVVNSEQYDHTIFWNKDHKLAISTSALLPLYKAAVNAFMSTYVQYKMLINSSEATNSFPLGSRAFLLEKELMGHSKALVILSYDLRSAWNSRKLVFSRNPSLSLLNEELKLSELILSYAPKSECAWDHRRWVIKIIAGYQHNLSEVVTKESELVEKISKNSKMNYRAWNHNGWLISYMTVKQILNELNRSRKWAELHVADNCCFHHRRRLMLQILEENHLRMLEACIDYKYEIYLVWKEEFTWNAMLIQRYIGREALWIHRRFLFHCWVKHFLDYQSALWPHSENYKLDSLLNNELEFLHSCSSNSDDAFEDSQVHAELAAAYIFWITKKIPPFSEPEIQEKLESLRDLRTMLCEISPEKSLLWKSLVG